MNIIEELDRQRLCILREMEAIRYMSRGTVSEQFLNVKHKGKSKPVKRGPYYLFSRREGGRTVGRRLTSQKELEVARRDIAAYKKFVELCREFEELTERLGEIERCPETMDVVKKTLKSRSRKKEK